MDGLLIGSGLAALLIGVQAIVKPASMVRQSLRNRNRRLEELRNGAAENCFEERRELEAYPPRFDLDDRTIRALGVVGTVIGLISLYQGLAQ